MIQDKELLEHLANSWQEVRSIQSFIKRQVLTGFALGANNMRSVDAPLHNLILIYAYAVLENILEKLGKEGHFTSTGWGLKRLMNDSKTLKWTDFATVNRGRCRRNDIAHRSVLIPRSECSEYIDAIENELLGWQIIKKPV